MKPKFIKIILVCLICLVLLVPSASHAQSGFSLVPCGASQGSNTQPCKFSDLLVGLIRLINFLFAASSVVTFYYILSNSWGLVSALGNPEKIKGSKDGLTRAIIGFSIILLSFVFINLLVQGLFQLKNPGTNTPCTWWTNPTQLWVCT